MKHSTPGFPLAIFAAVVVAALAQSAPASAEPRCTVLQFLDAKGVVITTTAPIVGMLVGDKPVYEGSVPVAASIKPGAEVTCPTRLASASSAAIRPPPNIRSTARSSTRAAPTS
jgi:hypothetical protein